MKKTRRGGVRLYIVTYKGFIRQAERREASLSAGVIDGQSSKPTPPQRFECATARVMSGAIDWISAAADWQKADACDDARAALRSGPRTTRRKLPLRTSRPTRNIFMKPRQ